MSQPRTGMVVVIMVLIGLTASHGHGESMGDDQRLILAADKNDTATVLQLLKAGASLSVRDGQDARRCLRPPVTTMSKAPDS